MIDLVKELQARHAAILPGTHLLGSRETEEVVFKVWHNFPAIAEALTIAVEALERVRRAPHGVTPIARNTIVDDALARISSLNSK